MSRQLLFLLTLTATVVLSTHNPKIAILGGGISSLSTAYNLLTHSTQDLDITLYQVGWRLGGKAHTGRNPNHGDRIEEHGVHLLFGGYRYVFEVMDRVYRELGRPNEHPLARWEDVVLAQNEITVADFQGGTCNGSGCFGPGTWQQISIPFPKMGPDPWKTGIPWNSPEHLKKEIISSCTSYFLLLLRHLIPTPLPPSPSLATLVTIAEAHLHTIPPPRELYAIFRIFLATAVGILRANFSSEGFWPYLEKRDFRAFLVENGCPDDSYVLYQTPIRLAYYASFHDAAGGPREQFAAATALQMFYYTLTYRGSFSYYMLPGTGETLVLPLYQFLVNRGVRFEFFHNVVDIRTGDNGGTDGNGGHASVGGTDRNDGNGGHASVGGTDQNDGNGGHASVGGTDQNDGNGGHASVGGTDRNDGNGGHPSVGGTYGNNSDGVNFIDVIEIDVQAELADPSVPYYPLINITTPKGTFEAWPNTPLYDQISAEQRNILRGYNLESPWSSGYPVRKKFLRRGVDFDVVVSGLPVAVYRHIGEGLRRSSQRWDAMVRGVQTTPTFGIQLWFTKTPQDLGAKLPSALDGTVEEFKLLAYDSPFEGFADYSHTLPYENHPLAKSVLYLSDTLDPIPGTHPFSDQDYPQQEKNLLIQRVDKWLNSRFLSVYPKAADEKGGFDYNLLVDITNGTGIDRLRAQWFSVNIDPSNLYTLASSGTHQFRIRPDESPWENLFLVGDWTNLDYDLGCADNAVYSGQVAAEKILKRFGVFK